MIGTATLTPVVAKEYHKTVIKDGFHSKCPLRGASQKRTGEDEFTTTEFAIAVCKNTSGTTLSAHKTERSDYHPDLARASEKTSMPRKKWVIEVHHASQTSAIWLSSRRKQGLFSRQKRG